jgi:hypothetical protein
MFSRMDLIVFVRSSILLWRSAELRLSHGFKQYAVLKSELFRLQWILFWSLQVFELQLFFIIPHVRLGCYIYLHIKCPRFSVCIVSSTNGMCFSDYYSFVNRLCGLVVRVFAYRSEGPGSIPSTTRKKSSGSGKGSTQPREYNWGATW